MRENLENRYIHLNYNSKTWISFVDLTAKYHNFMRVSDSCRWTVGELLQGSRDQAESRTVPMHGGRGMISSAAHPKQSSDLTCHNDLSI